MKKLLIFIKLSISSAIEYRGDILLYVFGNITQPMVILLIWLAISKSSGTLPISQNELIVYYLLVIILHLITSTWGAIFITSDIRLGKLSPFLTKPASYLLHQIGNNIGEKLIKAIYTIPLVIILGLIFHATLPELSFISLIIFIISCFLSATIMFMIDICIGICAFWMETTESLEDLFDMLLHLFSGRLAPLFMLPIFMQNIAFITPFRYLLSFPIEIITGKISPTQVVIGIGFQLFWLTLSIFVYKVLWGKGIRRYTAVGI